MAERAEQRRYYPGEENVPLSVASERAVRATESAPSLRDEFEPYDRGSADAIDIPFTSTDGVDTSVQIRLPDVTVAVWSDGGVDSRVTDADEWGAEPRRRTTRRTRRQRSAAGVAPVATPPPSHTRRAIAAS